MKFREADVELIEPSPLAEKPEPFYDDELATVWTPTEKPGFTIPPAPPTDEEIVAIMCADHGYLSATCPGCGR